MIGEEYRQFQYLDVEQSQNRKALAANKSLKTRLVWKISYKVVNDIYTKNKFGGHIGQWWR